VTELVVVIVPICHLLVLGYNPCLLLESYKTRKLTVSV